jgi:hypothetical protein
LSKRRKLFDDIPELLRTRLTWVPRFSAYNEAKKSIAMAFEGTSYDIRALE